MNKKTTFVERVRVAINAQLDKHEDEFEINAVETTAVRITVKTVRAKVTKVVLSRETESDIQ